MNFTQEVQPNLSTVGIVGLCEKYTEDVFGVSTSRHDADAHAGWLNDAGQHPGETPPSNISVPLAFDWFGTVDGIYKNWGHRCVWVNGKVYSSPLSGTGHLVYPSIPAIKAAFGLGNYLGWSECIEDLRVVKEGEEMLTPQQVDHVLKMGLHREPTAEELNNPAFANSAGLLIDTVWNNGGEANYLAETAPKPPVDPDSVTVTKDSLWASFKKFLGLS